MVCIIIAGLIIISNTRSKGVNENIITFLENIKRD